MHTWQRASLIPCSHDTDISGSGTGGQGAAADYSSLHLELWGPPPCNRAPLNITLGDLYTVSDA